MVRRWSEPDEMEWADVETPEPGPGEVRIRNRAAALNFFDILQIQGKYQVRPPFPFTPGAEIAGEIDAVGEGVTEWKAGDRVMAMPQVGGFAEYTVADAVKVFAMPAGMDWAQAAAMPIVYHTSYFALRDRAPTQAWRVAAGARGRERHRDVGDPTGMRVGRARDCHRGIGREAGVRAAAGRGTCTGLQLGLLGG
jgi:NADPH:quinone reductase-like Zn-dependent oxidoreductase